MAGMDKVPRIELPRKKDRACSVWLVCVFLFLVFVVFGSTAPEVLKARESGETAAIFSEANSTSTYAFSFKTEKQNQLFWVEMRISTVNGDLSEVVTDTMLDVELDMTFSVHSASDNPVMLVDSKDITKVTRCDVTLNSCEYFQLWSSDHIDHSRYVFNVIINEPEELASIRRTDNDEPLFDINAKVIYVNPDFTRFSVGWKYTFLALTCLIIFWPGGFGALGLGGEGFVIAFCKTRHGTDDANFAFHRRWALVLLVGLIFFDNPFLLGAIYSNNAREFSGFFIICVAFFLFLLLLHWLCLFSNLRFMDQQVIAVDTPRKSFVYWGPKVLLSFGIALTVLHSYIFYRFDDSTNFEYNGVGDKKHKSVVNEVFLVLLVAVYLIWIIHLLYSSRDLLDHLFRSITLLNRSFSYLVLYSLSLFACELVLVGLITASFYPYSTSTSVSLALHGVINIYVWGLAICFTPVEKVRNASVAGEHTNGVQATEEAGMAGVYPPATTNFDVTGPSNI